MSDIKHIYKDIHYSYPVHKDLKSLRNSTKILATTIDELYPGKIPLIYCRGTSGILIATNLAVHFPDSRIYLIRKPGESTHSDSEIYSVYPGSGDTISIIVDDQVSSGDTMQAIYKNLTIHNLYLNIEIISIALQTDKFNYSIFPNLKYVIARKEN